MSFMSSLAFKSEVVVQLFPSVIVRLAFHLRKSAIRALRLRVEG